MDLHYSSLFCSTLQTMGGGLSFREALKRRLNLLKPTLSQVWYCCMMAIPHVFPFFHSCLEVIHRAKPRHTCTLIGFSQSRLGPGLHKCVYMQSTQSSWSLQLNQARVCMTEAAVRGAYRGLWLRPCIPGLGSAVKSSYAVLISFLVGG